MSDLVAIYEAGDEDVRMVTASNRVEWERTLELLERWLRPRPRGCWTSEAVRAGTRRGSLSVATPSSCWTRCPSTYGKLALVGSRRLRVTRGLCPTATRRLTRSLCSARSTTCRLL